jgi:3-oxoacyl-[acyl-carrier-protein] synthase-3
MMPAGARFDVGIEAIAYRLGSRSETGLDLARDNPGWNIGEIEAKTGVKTRYLAAPGETASDMAEAAANELLGRGIDRAEIDGLIFVSQSPDHLLPTTACLLQDRLGLAKSCLAFDINQGCSGFVYGLGVATSLITAGLASKVLLLCGDTYTRYIKADDRTCRPIFSDGAAAILVAGAPRLPWAHSSSARTARAAKTSLSGAPAPATARPRRARSRRST